MFRSEGKMRQRKSSSKSSSFLSFDASERWGDAPCPCLGWCVHSVHRAKAEVNTVTMNLGWLSMFSILYVLVGTGIFISLPNWPVGNYGWGQVSRGFSQYFPPSLLPGEAATTHTAISHTSASPTHIGYHCQSPLPLTAYPGPRLKEYLATLVPQKIKWH